MDGTIGVPVNLCLEKMMLDYGSCKNQKKKSDPCCLFLFLHLCLCC